MTTKSPGRRGTLSAVSALGLAWCVLGLLPRAGAEDRPQDAGPAAAGPTKVQSVDGREIFAREWIPNDKRSHGGDGLGPLFNESSCVGCHNQGGLGGAGPASKNAQLLTAFPNPAVQMQQRSGTPQPAKSLPEQVFRGLFGTLDEPQADARPTPVAPPQQAVPADAPVQKVAVPKPVPPRATQAAPLRAVQADVAFDREAPAATFEFSGAPAQAARRAATFTPEQLAQFEKERKNLASVHPGLATIPSIVLHRSGTYPEYEAFRNKLANGHQLSFVSPSAPFGADFTVTTFGSTGVATLIEEPAGIGQPPSTVRAVHAMPQNAAGFQLLHQHKQEAQMAAQRRLFNQAQQVGNFAIVRSERNTTALFGAGLVDAITDDDLRALEAKQTKERQVSGRVAALKDGKIGRFGWKGQIAHLDDFVLTACAVELGLNVPGHAQAGIPQKPDYKPAGLDLNDAECRALIDFVRDLPAPKQRPLADETDTAFVSAGQKLFAKIGCAECHVENVGQAEGVFSDLLLHDMGPDLGDSGSSYGISVPDSSPEGEVSTGGSLVKSGDGKADAAKKAVAATRQEWRTPPLWGVRDSAPYLHDGRADSLEQAIAFHGGESQASATKFFSLKPEERFQVITFLKSLVAPETSRVAAR